MQLEANWKNSGEFYSCYITSPPDKPLVVHYLDDGTTEKIKLQQLRGFLSVEAQIKLANESKPPDADPKSRVVECIGCGARYPSHVTVCEYCNSAL